VTWKSTGLVCKVSDGIRDTVIAPCLRHPNRGAIPDACPLGDPLASELHRRVS